ncbi:hypothetical protein TELCIR_10263 [Teladorsagia circumcincta]|uniref:SAC domain-containing protein n=1 Tax=Teladorsagia circumcincta TaxID=45464 RepID=A0A2G9UCJ3_TELCI|nr:hypothetical protein TELCIR_10263 [Teladorsagia circumcincta]
MRQAQRLGLFGPLCEPPEALVTLLQNMWADNGDVISTQYAGTAALKGDVTRSGERRLAGIMRDGYNSASRNKLYIAVYDDDFEKLEDVRIVPLEDVTSIEIGRSSRSARIYLRLASLEDSWMWRAGRTRLFNNVAIRLRSIEEAAEYTESIAEQISVTINLCMGKDVPVQRLERLSLPRSGNTAKKALASVAAAFKMRVRRPQTPATVPASRSYGWVYTYWRYRKMGDIATQSVKHDRT